MGINLDEYKSIRTQWIALCVNDDDCVNNDDVKYFDRFGVEYIPMWWQRPPWFQQENKSINPRKKMLHLKIVVIIVVWINVVWNIFKLTWMLLLKLLKRSIIII